MKLTKTSHAIIPQTGTIYTHTGLPIDKLRILDSDYPLEAMCADCGKPVTLDTPDSEWQHRG